nr:hypothetical protein [uncultured Undibacterium sp.]
MRFFKKMSICTIFMFAVVSVSYAQAVKEGSAEEYVILSRAFNKPTTIHIDQNATAPNWQEKLKTELMAQQSLDMLKKIDGIEDIYIIEQQSYRLRKAKKDFVIWGMDNESLKKLKLDTNSFYMASKTIEEDELKIDEKISLVDFTPIQNTIGGTLKERDFNFLKPLKYGAYTVIVPAEILLKGKVVSLNSRILIKMKKGVDRIKLISTIKAFIDKDAVPTMPGSFVILQTLEEYKG